YISPTCGAVALPMVKDITPPLLILFLPSSTSLRDLHSFPTRRSSDLYDAATNVATLTPSAGLATGTTYTAHVDASVKSSEGTPRSEEHTSELQSRENLVCRLLLEKKKKTPKTHQYASTLLHLQVSSPD